MNKIRLKIAQWIWPKQLKVGDHFTVVEWIKIKDRSWIGEDLICTKVIGNLVSFKHKVTGTYIQLSTGSEVIIKVTKIV